MKEALEETIVSDSSSTLLTILGIPVALAAMIAAIRALWRTVARLVAFANSLEYLVSRVNEIEQLLAHELRHNHGSSIKDDVHGTAIALQVANQRIDDLQNQISNLEEGNSSE